MIFPSPSPNVNALNLTNGKIIINKTITINGQVNWNMYFGSNNRQYDGPSPTNIDMSMLSQF